MKVTIERSVLLKALGHVHRIVERRNTIPILSNVLIEAAEGKRGAEEHRSRPRGDRDRRPPTSPGRRDHGCRRMSLRHRAQASRGRAGRASKSPATPGNCCCARAARASISQALPASDFPDLTSGEFSHRFTLPAIELKRLIDNTQFAISTEETRYYLNGIYLHTVDVGGTPMLRAVATDGHRLARVETPAPEGAVGMPGVIAPRKAVSEVLKLLEDLDAGRADRDLRPPRRASSSATSC